MNDVPKVSLADLYKESLPKEWVFHVYPDCWALINPYGDVYYSKPGELMEPAVNKMKDLEMDFRIEHHNIITLL